MTHQLLSISAAALGATLAMMSASPVGAQRTVDLGRAATSTVSLRISGTFAELRIRGWDRDSVALTGTIPADARLDGGFGGSPSRPTSGAKFYMETPSGVPAGKLELRVPAGARVWAKSGTADINVDGITGGLDLNIVGGSVRVSGAPHELSVESMDGTVTIEATAPWLRVKTATGDITLSGSGGEDVALATVSGTIRVVSGRYERARIESITGPLIFAGDLAPRATLDANTHSGPIELRLSPKSSVARGARSPAKMRGPVIDSMRARS